MGDPAKPKPHYHGHRSRLRARLLDAGADSVPDYELLEFLLTAANARGDTKPLAKDLLKRFGSLAGVLGASGAALTAVPGMGQAGRRRNSWPSAQRRSACCAASWRRDR